MNERIVKDLRWMEMVQPVVCKADSNDKITNWDHFYDVEAQFIDALQQLNKESAQVKISNLLDFIGTREGMYCAKNYLTVLSGLVTRKLIRSKLSGTESFSFNATCDSVIEEKLTKDNAKDIAFELIEFYLYVLNEKNYTHLTHDTVNQVIRYIEKNLLEPLSVESIAEKFSISTSHLSRIFKEQTNITLVEYINLRKVEESQYYLRFSNKKIAEISDEFHFCNQSYYTRMFKKYTNETPKKFRHSIDKKFFNYQIGESSGL